jgi:hypothetical protein
MNPAQLWKSKCLVSSMFSYLLATTVTLVCWVGWTYDIFPCGGDLAFYGPLARLSGYLAWPFAGGVNRLPPLNPVISVLLTWSIWFIGLRVCTAAWNTLVVHRKARSDKKQTE